jgi:hypothetical protein
MNVSEVAWVESPHHLGAAYRKAQALALLFVRLELLHSLLHVQFSHSTDDYIHSF